MTVAELSERLRMLPGTTKVHCVTGVLATCDFITLAYRQGSEPAQPLAHFTRSATVVDRVVFK